MATPESNPYYYFMYSYEHVTHRNEVEEMLGRRFECGTVVVNGSKKNYSYKATDTKGFFKQYPDAKIIAEGYAEQISYTECGAVDRRR
ncbi:MAG: hypothetical protein NC548_15810 [Lachnospiraceae bacterium]|nr:hypothetical protein [Lachnospiraceae bacterium]